MPNDTTAANGPVETMSQRQQAEAIGGYRCRIVHNVEGLNHDAN
jgi:hypothetical protein